MHTSQSSAPSEEKGREFYTCQRQSKERLASQKQWKASNFILCGDVGKKVRILLLSSATSRRKGGACYTSWGQVQKKEALLPVIIVKIDGCSTLVNSNIKDEISFVIFRLKPKERKSTLTS